MRAVRIEPFCVEKGVLSALRAVVLGALFWTLLGSVSGEAKPLLDTPVYNPETKSYFELIQIGLGYSIRGPSSPEIGWERARLFAMSRLYKGVPGRLAIVPSASVHEFLRDTFRPDWAAWIGLRYWCRYHKLQWVDGTELKPGSFQMWGPRWNVEGGSSKNTETSQCNQYFPVHYWGVQGGFYWNANGQLKEFYMFFIEYPTGSE